MEEKKESALKMIAILGGGLSGSLLAYRLSQKKPDLDYLLIEAQDKLGGEHTWSFHETDLPSHSMNWIKNLVASSWPQQEVRFHDFIRTLSRPYHSVTSSHLDRVIQSKVGDRLLLNSPVKKIDSNCIFLEGKKIEARVIFDARGLELGSLSPSGFQKFVGMDLEFETAHGLKHPIIMDANCHQKEGYRFFYILPWDSHSVLVEDTRYTTDPSLDVEDLRFEIRNYCARSGWKIKKELRTEAGALPIPLAPFTAKQRESNLEKIDLGLRGEYFHWTTGYSFPYAVRTAETISNIFLENPEATAEEITRALRPLQNEIKRQSRYFALLNRMLFLAAQPSERWRIFHRFYHLNEELICRFYKGNLRLFDQARILIGRPPVPVYPAIKCVLNRNRHSEVYGKDSSDAL